MNNVETLIFETAREFIHVVSIDVDKPFVLTERVFRSQGTKPPEPVELKIGELTLREKKRYKALGWAVRKKDLLNLGESEMAQGIINGAKAIVVWEK